VLAARKETLDSVTELKISNQLLISRRLIHPASGRTYHWYVPTMRSHAFFSLALTPLRVSVPVHLDRQRSL